MSRPRLTVCSYIHSVLRLLTLSYNRVLTPPPPLGWPSEHGDVINGLAFYGNLHCVNVVCQDSEHHLRDVFKDIQKKFGSPLLTMVLQCVRLLIQWHGSRGFELGHSTQHHYSAPPPWDMPGVKIVPCAFMNWRHHNMFGIKWPKTKCSW